MGRYGRLQLITHPTHGLVLHAYDQGVLAEILRSAKIKPLIGARIDLETVIVHPSERGNIKQQLIKLGWPAEDLAGFVDGESHPLSLVENGWNLRGYQSEAVETFLHGGSGVVVLPCGAGKTIVGQFAAYFSVAKQSRCFYTTPIKALSNQKFSEFVEIFGEEHVGLLTGDNTINGDAPIVVMTTEVLRNMLYESTRNLADLSHVVMDEVHYLADRSRGAVWEEVIIHLPEHVRVVALSATVSNAEEFGDWLSTVRGKTDVIVEEVRPTPLHQMVKDPLEVRTLKELRNRK
jgi:ATP-dependent RNA helicase HelY